MTSVLEAREPALQGGVREIDAGTARRWLESGAAVLIDVREPDEHARERIAGAKLNPLSRFDPGLIGAAPGQRVVLHCKGGKRSADACRLAASRAGTEVFSLAGGIEAWKKAGLPVISGGRGPGVSVMRQVQMVVGGAVLAGSALAWLAHPWFLAVPAFFGAGLLFAGISGTCALASVLGRMPWNRSSAGGPASCAVSM